MSRTFRFTRDPYEDKDYIYNKATFTFEPGVTVLVGCNGSGKTTLLKHIENKVKNDKNSILVKYNNLHDGGSNAISKAGFYGDMSLMATLVNSSEGESIMTNLNTIAAQIGRAVRENKDNNKDLFILLDAIDSGFSVDNILDLKEYLFETILKDCNEKRDVYIICSANEYELCNGEKCFDVQNAKYMEFKNYEEYREFILNSRKNKDKRFS